VGEPCLEEDMVVGKVTPQECRLRDITYSAPIYVNLRYTRGKEELVIRNNVMIGRMPIMLRSSHCILANATEEQMAKYKECPLDPGNRFVSSSLLLFRSKRDIHYLFIYLFIY
jgi:DNA-directed RNA polymerase III subunit RPC2